MRILLTGGGGFIGRHIADRLRSGHEVFAPTHAELDLADADAVRRWLAATRVDAVVHAAVKPAHRNAPDQTGIAEQNLRQFFSLVRSRASFGRFVVLTSGAVYGVQGPIAGVAEDELGVVVPDDEHGFSKYVEALWLARDSNAIELRPFGVYGPGEDYAIRFISNACCKALLGMPVTLRQDRLFSYVWVDDLAAVIEHALSGGPGGGLAPGAYNVTPGEPISLRDVAALVVRISGQKVPIVIAKDGLGREYWGDGSKLAAGLRAMTFTNLLQGVERLLAWHSTRLEQIDRRVLQTDR